MRQKLLLVFSILLILCSCEFEESPEIIKYTFFELALLGIEITTAESVQDIYPDTKLRMYFYADLITTAEMTIEKILSRYSDEPSKLNEQLISITTEHKIKEWKIESINDGFEFVGSSFD